MSTPTNNSDTTSVDSPASTKSDDSEKTPVIKYVLYAITLVCIIALAYYSYNRFQDNKNTEDTSDSFTNEQERDDPQSDYNLHEAIRELKQLQNDIVGTLSNDTGI